MKECKFCGYVGEEWDITPKKKSMIFTCQLCGNIECHTHSIYQRKDFETLDDLLDFLNLASLLPDRIIEIYQWALGFVLIYYIQ